jgi:hypothetical protein
VLTAAHCVADNVPADLGPVDVAGAPGQSPLVTAISVHPRFDLDAFSRLENGWADHDVAVLQLDRAVAGVTPVRLGRARAGQDLQVVGRGATGGGAAPGVRGRPLLAATLRTQSDAACARFWRTYRDGHDRDSFEARLMLCGVDPRAGGAAGATRARATAAGPPSSAIAAGPSGRSASRAGAPAAAAAGLHPCSPRWRPSGPSSTGADSRGRPFPPAVPC